MEEWTEFAQEYLLHLVNYDSAPSTIMTVLLRQYYNVFYVYLRLNGQQWLSYQVRSRKHYFDNLNLVI